MLRVHCAVLNARTRPMPGSTCAQSYGGHGERETPGPIPNPEAKPLSADGTALETGWESRTPPDNHYRTGVGAIGSGLRFCVVRRSRHHSVRHACAHEHRGIDTTMTGP